ncbi:MAG: helix-turn-helix transcriptional regulator [Chitinophagaceae bacterium]|nr:helix-turn-helix transcriptional regulator [Chitinophagaceae bacterium]
MEFVNEYMYLSYEVNASITGSFCELKEDETNIHLIYGLHANDCLFDLVASSYQFQIRIAKTYLEKYNDTLDFIVEKQAICCNTQSKLLEIINCNLSGLHRKLFLESHILFLLYQSQKNSLIFQLNCENCSVINNPKDKDKIQQAQKFILENLDTNLTIPIIATNVGTNQCYLKKGFKEFFDQTIFDFIQENRMILAKHLLQNGNANITEIAYKVGYSSLSSFSQAYKNYFGISPTEQAKSLLTS